MSKLSVVLATFNEEQNIAACLDSVKDIADEIVIVDGESTDKTVEIAKDFQAKVIITKNHPIFHINKQKALELADHPWILQLDADERVSKELATEIKRVIEFTDEELANYQESLPQKTLFARHTKLLEARDGKIGTDEGSYTAFFIPRLNYFLGTYLRFGGVYPDGVIRLVRKGKAHFPCVSVHEQIVVDGKVGWLAHDLYHMGDPTFARYLMRWNRYTSLIAQELKQSKGGVLRGIDYLFLKPMWWFLLTYIRHKGFKDKWQGFMFSLFSSLRFPAAYIKHFKK